MQTTTLYYDDINIGDEAPIFTVPHISRTQIVCYAGASGDLKWLHCNGQFGKRVSSNEVRSRP